MKRSLGSTDSLGALMSICPTSEEQSPRNNHSMYSREFQTMLDGLDEEGCCIEESSGGGGHVIGGGEKKRRLSVDQVKALEKNFEVENKLEPERKVKLAQELGLQPRQVAVWFQNRRARWKTKQLERDYGVLKANYDSLKLNFDALQHDNEALLNEIRELKAKRDEEENTEISNLSVKEEIETASDDVDLIEQTTPPTEISLLGPGAHSKDYITATKNGVVHGGGGEGGAAEVSLFPDFKDGSSDSDSSAILTEDMSSPNAAMSSSSGAGNILKNLITLNCFQFQKSSNTSINQAQPQPFVKMEEHNFFSGDDTCNFFSDEQAPTLPWYTDEHAQFCEWK